MSEGLDPLILDLVEWVAREPRPYADVMEAWRTSCPRLSIWEDAIGEELVRFEPREGRPMRDARVAITPRGLARMAQSGFNAPVTDAISIAR